MALQYVSEGHQVEMITFTLQYPSFLFPGKTQFTSDPQPDNISIQRKNQRYLSFKLVKSR